MFFEYYIATPAFGNTVVNGLPNAGNWITYSAPYGGDPGTHFTQLYVEVVSVPCRVCLTPLSGPTSDPAQEWPGFTGSTVDQATSGLLTLTKLEVYSSP